MLRLDEALLAGLAGVECVNGSDSTLQDSSSRGLAMQFALPGIGGSDAHSLEELGRSLTVCDSTDMEGLLAAIRAGKTKAVGNERKGLGSRV